MKVSMEKERRQQEVTRELEVQMDMRLLLGFLFHPLVPTEPH